MATTTKSRTTTRVAKKKPPVAKKKPVVAERLKDRVQIVGFAPSWIETPWDDADTERWGLNVLHKVAGDKPFTRWYQLHDISTHHKDDVEHLEWLRAQKMPIIMWEDHIERYEIPSAVPYPKDEILEYFGGYFTNSISWMIAHAILQGYAQIGVYGVDMATDSEYGSQRPSCEYFLGWAKGAGIDIQLPKTSDLLATPWLYGVEEGGAFRLKMESRLKELQARQAEITQQVNTGQVALQQIAGAIENNQYYLRAWSMPTPSAPSLNGGPDNG